MAPTRLYAFLLRIRPVQSGTLMAFSGEFVHGAFLRWLHETTPEVSAWLHAGNKRRLFTCSSLQFGLPPQHVLSAERDNVHLPLDPQKTYFIRITLLLGELFPLLYEALMRYSTNSGQEAQHFLRLGKQRFTLEEMLLTPSHPQCGFTSLTTLVEQAQQIQGNALERLTLDFSYLTTFNRSKLVKDGGYGPHYALLPLPHYVFPNLARRWEDIAPPELAGAVQPQRIEEYSLTDGVIITNYELQPHLIHFTKHIQQGFVGRCSYALRDTLHTEVETNEGRDQELSIRQQLWLLSQLAFYTGVGYKTAMGMGRTRVV